MDTKRTFDVFDEAEVDEEILKESRSMMPEMYDDSRRYEIYESMVLFGTGVLAGNIDPNALSESGRAIAGNIEEHLTDMVPFSKEEVQQYLDAKLWV